MTEEEIIEMGMQAGISKPVLFLGNNLKLLTAFAKLVAEKEVEEANHIIFKSCINLPHWKRTAMRYLKRNAPMLHYQAVHEFNEHPDGRGQE
jgi:hypothetical protein